MLFRLPSRHAVRPPQPHLASRVAPSPKARALSLADSALRLQKPNADDDDLTRRPHHHRIDDDDDDDDDDDEDDEDEDDDASSCFCSKRKEDFGSTDDSAPTDIGCPTRIQRVAWRARENVRGPGQASISASVPNHAPRAVPCCVASSEKGAPSGTRQKGNQLHETFRHLACPPSCASPWPGDRDMAMAARTETAAARLWPHPRSRAAAAKSQVTRKGTRHERGGSTRPTEDKFRTPGGQEKSPTNRHRRGEGAFSLSSATATATQGRGFARGYDISRTCMQESPALQARVGTTGARNPLRGGDGSGEDGFPREHTETRGHADESISSYVRPRPVRAIACY
jgi:hypothetical protein